MPTPPSQLPNYQSIELLVVLIAAVCVIYWRAALKLAAIAVITLTIYGSVLLVEVLNHTHR
jgi:hypothetical protein